MTNAPDMTGRICLLTGANTGIGKETAIGLAAMNATLILACRNLAKAEAARQEIAQKARNPNITVMHLDLSSLDDVRQFAKKFLDHNDTLHVLINNAGIMRAKREVTVDGFEAMLQVNYLAPFLLTELVLDLLKRSAPSRIVNVASSAESMGHLDLNDLQMEHSFNSMGGYGRSKKALILYTRELAERLKSTGVTANSLHPGISLTQLGDQLPVAAKIAVKLMSKSVKEISETSIYLASSPNVSGVTGKYFIDKTEANSSPQTQDMALARKLWDMTEPLVGLTPDSKR